LRVNYYRKDGRSLESIPDVRTALGLSIGRVALKAAQFRIDPAKAKMHSVEVLAMF
jgi:hypothetical protein